jgi:hypothetical protein
MSCCGLCARCQYVTMFPDSQMVGFITFSTDCAQQKRQSLSSASSSEPQDVSNESAIPQDASPLETFCVMLLFS